MQITWKVAGITLVGPFGIAIVESGGLARGAPGALVDCDSQDNLRMTFASVAERAKTQALTQEILGLASPRSEARRAHFAGLGIVPR